MEANSKLAEATNRHIRTLTAIFTFCCSIIASAFGADIDAPLTQNPVRIRSEIDRGVSAAPDNTKVKILDYVEAVDAVENANKQRNTDSKAFQFGLSYVAWHNLWLALSLGVYREPTERNLAEVDCNTFFIMTQALRKQLGLTDEQVKELGSPRYITNEEIRFPQIVKTRQFRNTYPLPSKTATEKQTH